MFGLIGVLFGALGFMGNMLLIVIVYVAITTIISDLIYKGFQKLFLIYRNIRTAYYKIRLEKNPHNIMLKDKWRRSEMHLLILGMQSYMSFLKEKYGSFDICPGCKFPHEPDTYSCSYCNYVNKDALT